MTYEYDTFNLAAVSVDSTPAPLGQDGVGTVIVSTNYRMRMSGMTINAGTVQATVSIYKVNYVTGATVTIRERNIAANDSYTYGEDQDLTVGEGFYVEATLSAGTGSIFATGSFELG